MQHWRVCSAKYASTALSGEGAFRYGGRWNSVGKRVVYVGPSVSAAALEILVHAGSVTNKYAAIRIDLPRRFLSELDMSGAPVDWQRRGMWCRQQGDQWFDSGASAGLIVPSAVLGTEVPERNVVLNVEHKDFVKIATTAIPPIDLWLDERLGPPTIA